ncbi:MAG: ATP-binding protein [Actinomycetota bacterium]
MDSELRTQRSFNLGALRPVLPVIVSIALFWATLELNRYLVDPEGRAIAWLPTGVMVAALLAVDRRLWSILGLGATALMVYRLPRFGLVGADAALVLLVLNLSWFLPAVLLSRGGRDPRGLLDRPQGLVKILVASVVGGTLAVIVGGALLPLTNIRQPNIREAVELWAVSFALGSLLVTCLWVAWSRGRYCDSKSSVRAAVSVIGGVVIVLPIWTTDLQPTTLSFLSMTAIALLIWMAVAVGRRAILTLLTCYLVLSSWFTSRGYRPPGSAEISTQEVISTNQVTYIALTVGLVLVAIVIQMRREAARRVDEQAEEMRIIRDAVPDAIVTVRPDGEMVAVNGAASTLFGADDLEGRGLWDFLSEESRGWVLAGLQPVHEGATDTVLGRLVELTVRTLDGQEIVVEASTVAHEVGGVPAITLVLRDIRDRKRAEEDLRRFANELERSNHDLAEFAYVASHDLQEPLRMVSFYVKLLAERYGGQLDNDADEYIHFAADGAERMQALVHDLLTYSRAGTTVLDPTLVSAKDAAVDAIALLRGAIDRRGARVEVGDLPEVLANKVLLVQVFQNLIGNALKFCDQQEPKVVLEAERWGDSWCVTVSDNGIGIPEEQRERIFQPFRRLASRKRFEGNGIGLAVCKKIIDRHGGRIWVEAGPEGGSRFRFTISGALRKTA